MKLSINNINTMSYTDFVGLINQWNVPPGSYATINKWALFGHVNAKSRVLEVACTTGFSLRELSILTNCNGTGFDISKLSVEKAIKNKNEHATKCDIDFTCEDGYNFFTEEKFSHIIFGASLRFFPDSVAMFNKAISMLKDKGCILSCEFYIVKPIPVSLVVEAKRTFGITITQEKYKKVMGTYKGLELLYEEKNVPTMETKAELKHYCESTVNRACKMHNIDDSRIRKIIFDRIYKIKDMSNRLRPYQNYNVLVHRYREKLYPNRYVELF